MNSQIVKSALIVALVSLGSQASATEKVDVPEYMQTAHKAPQTQSQTVVIKSEKVSPADAMESARLSSPVQSVMSKNNTLRLNVKGQGVAPSNTNSPAQAIALAKRAAIADAYRLLAEKVAGVRVEGQDFIRNMVVERSQVRTYVDALLRQSTLVETTFKDGLCEVEMELVIDGSRWHNTLSQSSSD